MCAKTNRRELTGLITLAVAAVAILVVTALTYRPTPAEVSARADADGAAARQTIANNDARADSAKAVTRNSTRKVRKKKKSATRTPKTYRPRSRDYLDDPNSTAADNPAPGGGYGE